MRPCCFHVDIIQLCIHWFYQLRPRTRKWLVRHSAKHKSDYSSDKWNKSWVLVSRARINAAMFLLAYQDKSYKTFFVVVVVVVVSIVDAIREWRAYLPVGFFPTWLVKHVHDDWLEFIKRLMARHITFHTIEKWEKQKKRIRHADWWCIDSIHDDKYRQ
jgi:hypothetical protein